jgi:hypothetical protein
VKFTKFCGKACGISFVNKIKAMLIQELTGFASTLQQLVTDSG